jgi:hypothetical protein
MLQGGSTPRDSDLPSTTDASHPRFHRNTVTGVSTLSFGNTDPHRDRTSPYTDTVIRLYGYSPKGSPTRSITASRAWVDIGLPRPTSVRQISVDLDQIFFFSSIFQIVLRLQLTLAQVSSPASEFVYAAYLRRREFRPPPSADSGCIATHPSKRDI